MPPRVCPNCGSTVPPRSLACPECGSDDETGWSEDAGTANPDLPDDHFDYKEFIGREFGEPQPKPRGIAWLWWIVAILVLVVMLLAFLHIH